MEGDGRRWKAMCTFGARRADAVLEVDGDGLQRGGLARPHPRMPLVVQLRAHRAGVPHPVAGLLDVARIVLADRFRVLLPPPVRVHDGHAAALEALGDVDRAGEALGQRGLVLAARREAGLDEARLAGEARRRVRHAPHLRLDVAGVVAAQVDLLDAELAAAPPPDLKLRGAELQRHGARLRRGDHGPQHHGVLVLGVRLPLRVAAVAVKELRSATSLRRLHEGGPWHLRSPHAMKFDALLAACGIRFSGNSAHAISKGNSSVGCAGGDDVPNRERSDDSFYQTNIPG